MAYMQRTSFNLMPPVVKNLLIINGLAFLANITLSNLIGTRLNFLMGLYYPESPYFEPFQLVTHLFMHGSFIHLFTNMFALWMFGSLIENYLGSKRFFLYYFICGIGASLLHLSVNQYSYSQLTEQLSPAQINDAYEAGRQLMMRGQGFRNNAQQELYLILNTPTVGASGAVFGILLAFGYLFPNQRIFLLFPPIPLKAKYFVIGYGLFELYAGFNNQGSNIAHFAHIGGMLFGFVTLKLWERNRSNF